MKTKYLRKLEEKRVNDRDIKRKKEDPNFDGLMMHNDLTKRISFHIALKEWAPGIVTLGSAYGDEPIELLVQLDEEDMEYFRKKYVNSEAVREEEYEEKLKALNREYGK
jgi:hypothetical protein